MNREVECSNVALERSNVQIPIRLAKRQRRQTFERPP